MVQITHARLRDDETGKPVRISAANFDKATDGKKLCQCPDPDCSAILTHYKSYLQTFYDLVTNEPYKLKVPAHFKRAEGSPPHSLECTAVDQYTIYQSYARDIGGLSQMHGRFVYNLNIMTNDDTAPVRHPRKAGDPFNNAATRENKSDGQGHEHRKLSQGLNSVKKLAGLLDHTEFDKEYRESILLRDGRKSYTLAQLFRNDTLALFRERHTQAKNGDAPQPVLLQFKPIVLGQFHSKKERTIQGQAVTVRGGDGRDYSVSVKLHCASREIYDSLKQEIRAGKRSFLVYAESATVDLVEFAHKKHEIQQGTAKDRTVFVHVRVGMPQQMTPWVPYDGQLDLQNAGIELPLHMRPPREIPQHLLK